MIDKKKLSTAQTVRIFSEQQKRELLNELQVFGPSPNERATQKILHAVIELLSEKK